MKTTITIGMFFLAWLHSQPSEPCSCPPVQICLPCVPCDSCPPFKPCKPCSPLKTCEPRPIDEEDSVETPTQWSWTNYFLSFVAAMSVGGNILKVFPIKKFIISFFQRKVLLFLSLFSNRPCQYLYNWLDDKVNAGDQAAAHNDFQHQTTQGTSRSEGEKTRATVNRKTQETKASLGKQQASLDRQQASLDRQESSLARQDQHLSKQQASLDKQQAILKDILDDIIYQRRRMEFPRGVFPRPTRAVRDFREIRQQHERTNAVIAQHTKNATNAKDTKDAKDAKHDTAPP